MRIVTTIAVAVAVAAAAAAAVNASDLNCSAPAIVHSQSYALCQITTGIDLTTDAGSVIRPAVFCGDADCLALWGSVQRLGALACFQRHDAGIYSLHSVVSAQLCFVTFQKPPVVQFERVLQTTTTALNSTNSTNQPQPELESALVPNVGTNSPSESSVSRTTTSDEQGTSMQAVWIALGSCGAGVVLLVILSISIRRRKAKKMEAKVLECLDHSVDYVQTLHASRSNRSLVNSNTSDPGSSARSRSRRSPRVACLDDDLILAVRIPYGKLTVSALVSRGGFGEVYRGMYRSKVVAVKRLLPEKRHDLSQIENFVTEAKLMVVLEHEHIVQFVGVAWDSIDELCVVTEFMALGDLRSLLWKYDMDEDAHPRGFNADKLKIALHVAKALTYMHSLRPVVLHRDVKSRNILLDEKLDAKVTDFGVSRQRADSTMTTGVGSTLWMAPEVMTGGRYNEKADVFSFGVVLSELDTHTIPYTHAVESNLGRRLPDTVIVQMMTLSRISVEFTNEPDSPMAQLGRRCVQLDPTKRPTALEVQETIEALWNSVVVAL